MSFQDKNIMLKGTPTYSAYEKDIAVVNLYFGDSTVFGIDVSFSTADIALKKSLYICVHPEYERAPKMTWLDFISGFGGICGLCLGISFVSVTELVYWFSVRLCRTLVI